MKALENIINIIVENFLFFIILAAIPQIATMMIRKFQDRLIKKVKEEKIAIRYRKEVCCISLVVINILGLFLRYTIAFYKHNETIFVILVFFLFLSYRFILFADCKKNTVDNY